MDLFSIKENLSIRSRLLFGAFILIPLMLFVAGFTLTSTFSEHKEKQFQEKLQTNLQQLVSSLHVNHNKVVMDTKLSDPYFSQPYSGLYWQVSQNDVPLFRSVSLSEDALKLLNEVPEDGGNYGFIIPGPQHQTLRVLEQRIKLGSSKIIVAVAGDHREVEESVHQYSTTIALIFYILGVGMFMIVTFQVWGGLLPLHILQQKLIDVRSGKLSKIDSQFPTEVQPLVDELNALITNNAEVLKRSRMEAGNLVHALKTPLAVISAVINDEKNSEMREKLYSQLTKIQHQIDYTLVHASAAMSADVIHAHCKVNQKVDDIIHALKTLYKEKHIRITSHLKPNLHIKVEEQDFEEIFGNVMDNACKWTKSEIKLSFVAQNGWLNILVDDNGPGLSASKREIVFKRGQRLDDSVPGFGLGLSIVRSLVESYRGKVALEDSPIGGLRVNLLLPIDIA